MANTKLYLARACHNTGDTLFVFLKRPSKTYLKQLGCAGKCKTTTSGDEFTYWVNILLTRHNGFPVNVTPHNGYYEVKTAMHWRPYRYFVQFHEGPHFNDAESLYEYLVPNGAVRRKTPRRDLRTALEIFYRESNLTRRPQMLEKTFINLSKETYQFIEREGLACGDVFDYPAAELDDLINGTVGDTEQTLYARYVDDDGEVRYGELSQVNISRFDNTYYISSGPQQEVKAKATSLGEVIEEAYALFKANGEGARVTVQSHNSDGTVQEILTLR
jgi:hypothetical protein